MSDSQVSSEQILAGFQRKLAEFNVQTVTFFAGLGAEVAASSLSEDQQRLLTTRASQLGFAVHLAQMLGGCTSPPTQTRMISSRPAVPRFNSQAAAAAPRSSAAAPLRPPALPVPPGVSAAVAAAGGAAAIQAAPLPVIMPLRKPRDSRGAKLEYDPNSPILIKAVTESKYYKVVERTVTGNTPNKKISDELAKIHDQLYGATLILIVHENLANAIRKVGCDSLDPNFDRLIVRIHEVRMKSLRAIELVLLMHDGTGADPKQPTLALGHTEFLNAIFRRFGLSNETTLSPPDEPTKKKGRGRPASTVRSGNLHAIMPLMKSSIIPRGGNPDDAPIMLKDIFPGVSVNKLLGCEEEEGQQQDERSSKRQKTEAGGGAAAAAAAAASSSSGDEKQFSASSSSSSSSSSAHLAQPPRVNPDNNFVGYDVAGFVPFTPSTPSNLPALPSLESPLKDAFGRPVALDAYGQLLDAYGQPMAMLPPATPSALATVVDEEMQDSGLHFGTNP